MRRRAVVRHALGITAAVAVLCAESAAALSEANGAICDSQVGSIQMHGLNASRHSSSGCSAQTAASRASWRGAHVGKPAAQTVAEIRAENDWKNDLVLWPIPMAHRERLPRIVSSWLRNYAMCLGLFVGIAAVWAYYIYVAFGAVLFRGRGRPAAADMFAQVKVWCGAIPVYAAMPAGIEWVAEQGWTRAYSRVADVGLGWHLLYFVAFMASVEAGVYAMHRSLHDVRLYRSLHHIHHQYNKQDALSPFAGLAFHPLDGIMQALPYCWTLFFVPAHFTTFELLLLATGVWTTSIHDTIDAQTPPLLGAGYHTLHHITYRHNYGHYTTLMDALCGTLLSPAEFAASTTRRPTAPGLESVPSPAGKEETAAAL